MKYEEALDELIVRGDILLQWVETSRKMLVELSNEHGLDNQEAADRINGAIKHWKELVNVLKLKSRAKK